MVRSGVPPLLCVELCLLKRQVEVLTPGTCECDLIWKWVFADVTKFRSLGRVLIQYDRCPCEKRRKDTGRETRREDALRWQRQKLEECGSKTQNTKDHRQPPGAEKDTEQTLPWNLDNIVPLLTLSCDF